MPKKAVVEEDPSEGSSDGGEESSEDEGSSGDEFYDDEQEGGDTDYDSSGSEDTEESVDEESDYDDGSDEDEGEGDESQESGDDEQDEIDEDEEEVDYRPDSRSCHLKDFGKEVPIEEDDSDIYARLEVTQVPMEERSTENVMSYYEIAGIIGARAQQFSLGAPPLVEGISHFSPPQMAYLELICGMTPFIINRKLPGKKYELWYVDELVINHKIDDRYLVPENFDPAPLIASAKPIIAEIQAKRAAARSQGALSR